jgi:hypothetical protein
MSDDTKVVFLDFDGCMNNHSFSEDAQSSSISPACVHRLNKILIETGAKVVLSSAWRYMIINKAMTIKGFDYMLRTHGVLSGRLIGHTKADEAISDRGWQIQDWIDENNHFGPYVVIDDMDMGSMHPSVLCDGSVGLTDEDVERAISILGRI